MKRRFVAGFVALLAFVAPAVFSSAPAAAFGEVTYPGVGYAISSSTWRDVVYCKSRSTDHWLEISVDSTRTVSPTDGRVRIKPNAIRFTRIFHNSSGQHEYKWLGNPLSHDIHIQQRSGSVPQYLVNEWNPTWMSWEPYMINGQATALFSDWNTSLRWSSALEEGNPHLYFSGYLQYIYVSGGQVFSTNEIFQEGCAVDLGP